jgi:hypothetical protein
MGFELRSASNKKPIIVQTYEEAQALRVLCLEQYGREIEVSGEIPDEFNIDNYYYHRFNNWHRRSRFPKPFNRDFKSPDLVILGMDLANFETIDYTSLLQPYITDNAKLVEQFKAGNDKALNSLMGKFLKDHKGHDAKVIKDTLTEMLTT